MRGFGRVMLRFLSFERRPPGAGLNTVIFDPPAAAMSAAGIAALSCVLVRKVVGRSAPFHRTVEPFRKFDPNKVRLNPGLPAAIWFGLIPEIEGTGLFGGVTAKVNTFEMKPSGLETVTLRVPGEAMSAAKIAAVTCVEVRNVVVRLDPLQSTWEPLTKFAPLTVRTKPGFPAGI